MTLNFPNSPTNGQVFGSYTYDSSLPGWRSTPELASGMPAGTIVQWPSNIAPANWLICDGSAVSRSTYASLFAAIGVQYGVGDGSTTFNLPDLRGRVGVGRDSGQTEFDTLGETGGAKTHTLTTSEMPSHTHSTQYVYYVPNFNDATVNNIYPAGGAISAGNSGLTNKSSNSTGGGSAHNNLQPYVVLNYIIKVSAGITAGDSELATRVGAIETDNSTLNKAGLVLISENVFSAASVLSVNNAFTSTYENYRVVISNLTNTNPGIVQLWMRMRASGVDAAGGTDYRTAYIRYYSGGMANGASNGQAVMGLGYVSAGGDSSITFDIFRPAVADVTLLTFDGWNWQSDIATYIFVSGGNMHKLSNSYDGFSLSSDAGNLAGNIRIYGYRNN